MDEMILERIYYNGCNKDYLNIAINSIIKTNLDIVSIHFLLTKLNNATT